MRKKVEWTEKAKKSLDYYCDRIALESISSSRKVRKEIILTSKRLSNNPELFQLDEYYPDNQGDIRRYFKWNYRVVYRVSAKKVTVLNVYHTSIQPDTTTP